MKDIDEMNLEELREELKGLTPGPYFHNMVGVILNVIDKKFGEQEALCAIEDFGLTFGD